MNIQKINIHSWVATLFFLMGSFLMAPAFSQATPQDDLLKKSGVEQHFGAMAALDTPWTASDGKKVMLNALFGKKPVILVPVYYTCPMLCQLVLKGLAKGLNQLDLKTNDDFDLVIFSINPQDTVANAAAKKKEFIADYTQHQHARQITFLTGSEMAIRLLTQSIGFKFVKDPLSGEYVHSAILVFLSPEGKIMRYMGGIDFDPRSVKLALIESANGKVGSFWDQILLVCYHYNPANGKYGMAVNRILQGTGLLTVFCLIFFIVRSLRNENIATKRRLV